MDIIQKQNRNELPSQKSKDGLKEYSHKIINENGAPWASLFNGALSSATPSKVIYMINFFNYLYLCELNK